MQSKNSITQDAAQLLLKTIPVNFNEEFMMSQQPTVADALNESSSLLCSAKFLISQLSEGGAIDEVAAFGLLFIVTGAKALLDSTVVSVEQAIGQGGTQ
ncbi:MULTISPECIES: hypothetical protein [Pseudomonas syringae group]|uniref:hypothetical protein n=1 Tax=Pseudomonas syringae group TaxID=136849 RepID=UPI000E3177F9|nr:MULTISPECIES: hypothetical protein [Pseudomonas syringae group]RMV71989.1 hypothetical protein ALP06_00660 [Pseudomonas coronafaciens pv. atropurpurea]